MELLKLFDNELRAVPEDHLTHIPEFRALIDRDKSKDKSTASRELAYIYHVVDKKSPYNRLDESLRRERVKDELLPEDWEPDSVLYNAEKKYKELSRTLYTDLLESAEGAIRKLRDYFDEVDLVITDDRGKPIWSAKDLIANIAKLSDVITSHQKLREIIERDEIASSRNKRGIETNEFSE